MLSLNRHPLVSSASISTRAVFPHVYGRSSSSRHLACRSGTPYAVPAIPSRPVSTAAVYHLGHLEPFPHKKDAEQHFMNLQARYEPQCEPPVDCRQRDEYCSGDEIHPGDKGFEDLWNLWHHHPKANATYKHYKDKSIIHFTVERYNDTDKGWCKPPRLRVHYILNKSGCPGSRKFSVRQSLDNKQHAETTKKGGWAGPVAPETSSELWEANRQAQAFARMRKHQLAADRFRGQQPDSFYFAKMREQVWDLIRDFRPSQRSFQSFTCPINGSKVIYADDCHVDHYDPPFVVLAEMWLRQEGLQLSDVGCWNEWDRECPITSPQMLLC